MARLKGIPKIGRPASGRSVMCLNRDLLCRPIKSMTKKTIFPGDKARPHPARHDPIRIEVS